MRRVPFHSLRHGHVTMLLSAGVHLKIISERLGHAGIGITGNLYAHVQPTLQRDVADLAGRLIFGS